MTVNDRDHQQQEAPARASSMSGSSTDSSNGYVEERFRKGEMGASYILAKSGSSQEEYITGRVAYMHANEEHKKEDMPPSSSSNSTRPKNSSTAQIHFPDS